MKKNSMLLSIIFLIGIFGCSTQDFSNRISAKIELVNPLNSAFRVINGPLVISDKITLEEWETLETLYYSNNPLMAGLVPEYPMVFENITILTDGSTPGILIENYPNFYFEFRNCTLINTGSKMFEGAAIEIINSEKLNFSNIDLTSIKSEYGILIDGSENVYIQNTVVDGFNYGIYVNQSRDVEISHNNINCSLLYNVYLEKSENITLRNNAIFRCNNNVGLYLYESNENSINNNEIFENGQDGIYLSNSDFNVLKFNKINDNSRYGIYFFFSNNNTAINNTICFNTDSLYFFGSEHNLIGENYCDNSIPGYETMIIILIFLGFISKKIRKIKIKLSRKFPRFLQLQ